MMAWANLAEESATLISDAGFDATFEASTANGWERLDGVAASADEPSPGRLARMRQRVDALLTELLADDYDPRSDQEDGLGPEPELAEAGVPDSVLAESGTPREPGSGIRDGGLDTAPPVPDSVFWGPEESTRGLRDETAAKAYKSKHRLPGPEKAGPEKARPEKARPEKARPEKAGPERTGPGNSGRARPRHAAPPASLAVALGRWVASFRLIGRYAAHAA